MDFIAHIPMGAAPCTLFIFAAKALEGWGYSKLNSLLAQHIGQK